VGDLITTPYGFGSTTAEVSAGADLTGRRAIVTGVGQGLGRQTALALAALGADVTGTVRTGASGPVPRLDLADPASVAAFVDAWHGPLHLLVCNAGGILPELARTPAGVELQLAANHLGHFQLATGLYDALAAGAAEAGEARIVTLTSSGHLYSPVVVDDLHFRYRAYSDTLGYGQAKTANVLFGVGATARWAAAGITANAAMPGPTLTGFQRNMDPRRLRERLGDAAPGSVPPGFKTIEQGAATTVFLAVSPLVAGIGGRYFEDCAEAAVVADNNGFRSGVAPYALDPGNADRLWTESERLVALSRG